MRNRKFEKIAKFFKKLKKYHYGLISSQNRLEKDKKVRKQKLSLRFVPIRRVIQNSKKKNNKIQQIKIYHYGYISGQNRLVKGDKEKK